MTNHSPKYPAPPSVPKGPAPLEKLTLGPVSPIKIDGTIELAPTLTDERGNRRSNLVTYQSANPAIASVNAAGVVTGHQVGNVVITAIVDSLTATVSVTVS